MQLFFNSIKKSVRNTPELVLSDHRKIFEAILQRDESAVRSAIQDSISRWKENI
jgi:DNA-binding FadR family transcriptional regulator